MTSFDGSGTDTAVEGSSTVNQRRFTESIVLFEIVNCLKMYVIKMKEKKKKQEKPKKEN